MVDINVVVANNILDQMKKHNTKQIELANAVGGTKQIMDKILNGSWLISIAELRRIAECYQVHTDDLMREPAESYDTNVVRTFMGKVNTEAARDALRTADELADLILFHANVRENAKEMSETWEM